MASRAVLVRQTCCCLSIRVATIALAVYHIIKDEDEDEKHYVIGCCMSEAALCKA